MDGEKKPHSDHASLFELCLRTTEYLTMCGMCAPSSFGDEAATVIRVGKPRMAGQPAQEGDTAIT